MKKVTILKTFHVDRNGTTYIEGKEIEVSNKLARRHQETGFLKIIEPDNNVSPVKTDK